MTDHIQPSFQEHSETEQEQNLAQDLVLLLQEALEDEDAPRALELLEKLHASDVARAIQYLNGSLRERLIGYMRHRLDPEILTYLDTNIRGDILLCLGPEELSAVLSGLDSDDAFSILEDLDYSQKREILDSIPLENRAKLEAIFNYPESSAGRLMQREIAVVPSHWTVDQTLGHIASAKNIPETFYDIFIVDQDNHPIGVLPLSRLIKSQSCINVIDIMDEGIHTILVTLDQEDVALLFRKYSLVSAPVIDTAGKIVGMITVDDVVDVIDEEAEEDIMHLAGVAESDFYAPILYTSLARIRWLGATLVSTLLASVVISQFHTTLKSKVILAALMQIVAAMGGNSGMQVATVTVRALAMRELGSINTARAITKECFVATINGLFFATVLGSIVAFWSQDPSLGFVLGGAIIFNMLWAGFAGVTLPILIDFLGKDPALSAGPLLTTTTDVLGFSIFLGLAASFLM